MATQFRDTITIKFKPEGDTTLTNAIKKLDEATRSLLNSQAKLVDKEVQRNKTLNKNKAAIDKVNISLALQGSNWKKAGISADLYTKAVKGNKLSLAKVELATKKHLAALAKQRKGLLDTAHSTRILGGSFAVLRSKMLLVSFASTLVAMTLGKLIKATNRQEKAEKKLSVALTSTAKAAGLSHRQLTLMASELQAVTTHGDEAIIETQALMLTFTKIGKDVFPSALEAILNVSDAMGQDLKQSTIQIGKALNDPIQGMAALRRIGIQLSDVQENQIEQFMAVNDVAAAQKIIIDELDTQFGGMARGMRTTLAGSLMALGNAWGDTMEEMGEAMTPVISALATSLEEMTMIFKSEGEKQLIFLQKIGATDEQMRLARIRLLKEEAEERLRLAGVEDIEMDNADALIVSYHEQQSSLLALQDNLKEYKIGLQDSSLNLQESTSNSKEFNKALKDAERWLGASTAAKARLMKLGHVFGDTELEKMALAVVAGQENVEVTQEQIEALAEANEAVRAYLVSLGLISDISGDAGDALEQLKIKTASLTKIALAGLSDAFNPDIKAGDALKRFMISVIELFQGVILASKAMSQAVAFAFSPMGVPAAIGALVALEAAKALVRNIQFAEHGFEGVVDKPTLFVTGEKNKREHVSITPLESPNLGGGDGMSRVINVNISGGIVQEDYVSNTLIPEINRAVSLGSRINA